MISYQTKQRLDCSVIKPNNGQINQITVNWVSYQTK